MANNLTRFDPFGEMSRMSAFRGLDDIFKDLGMRAPFGSLEGQSQIKLDVSETENEYVVKAEIPGVKKDDLKVMIEGNRVSIRAETQRVSEEKEGETVLRRERYQGSMSRSFLLDHDIDDTRATARCQDGVLELTLPKRSGGGARQLEIS